MTDTFTVRHLDGQVRCYDGTGKALTTDTREYHGPADIELRPEAPQVDECRRLSAITDAAKGVR